MEEGRNEPWKKQELMIKLNETEEKIKMEMEWRPDRDRDGIESEDLIMDWNENKDGKKDLQGLGMELRRGVQRWDKRTFFP